VAKGKSQFAVCAKALRRVFQGCAVPQQLQGALPMLAVVPQDGPQIAATSLANMQQTKFDVIIHAVPVGPLPMQCVR